MRIASVEITIHRGSLATVAANARARWPERSGAIVRLRDDLGRIGLGEASPLPGYSPDTLEDCHAALVAARLPEIDESAPVVETLRSCSGVVDPRLPAARFAIESAVLDLLARRREAPAWALLSGQARPPVPVEIVSLVDTVAEGAEARARGVSRVKLKIGAPGRFERELETFATLRRGGPVRLDANGSLPPETADAQIARLADLEPELLEEPVPVESLPSLRQSPVPLALDESLQNIDRSPAVQRALDLECVKALVLKPAALGGIARCLDLAKTARAGGLEVVVSHLLDGPVALAAAASLCLSVPGGAAPSGLDRHSGLTAWPRLELPMLTATHVCPAGSPGLGIDKREIER